MSSQGWTSYRSLFRFSGVIYRLGRDGRLPAPLRVDSVVVFLFLCAVLYVPCWLLEPLFAKTLGIGKNFATIVAALAFTHTLSNTDPAGKFLPLYVLDILTFYAAPKKHRIGADFKPDRKQREECPVFLLEQEQLKLNFPKKGVDQPLNFPPSPSMTTSYSRKTPYSPSTAWGECPITTWPTTPKNSTSWRSTPYCRTSAGGGRSSSSPKR